VSAAWCCLISSRSLLSTGDRRQRGCRFSNALETRILWVESRLLWLSFKRYFGNVERKVFEFLWSLCLIDRTSNYFSVQFACRQKLFAVLFLRRYSEQTIRFSWTARLKDFQSRCKSSRASQSVSLCTKQAFNDLLISKEVRKLFVYCRKFYFKSTVASWCK
jgi:hypothetical protein